MYICTFALKTSTHARIRIEVLVLMMSQSQHKETCDWDQNVLKSMDQQLPWMFDSVIKGNQMKLFR